MQRSILSGVLSVASTKVLTLVIGLLTTPILYRILSPTEVGIYTTLLSVFSLFMIFVSSGVTDGVRKFLAEDREMECWEEHVVGFYGRLAFLLAVAGAGLLAVAAVAGIVERIFGPTFSAFFYILAVLVVVSQFREYIRRTLMGLGLERYSEPLKVLQRVVFVGVALPGAAYLGVAGALAGKAVASVSVGVVGFIILRRKISFGKLFRPTPGEFPREKMLTFNSLSIVLILLLMSLYHVDILMLQQLAGNTQVGYYRAALKLAEFLWFIPMALQTVFVHSTSELWSNDETEKISNLSARTTRYTFLLTGVMALGLAALADAAVPVYFGSDFTPAVTPLLLLLPGTLGFAIARPILAISQGKGDLKYPIAATGSAALINLALNALLIPRFGMHGAAVATSVGYGSMVLFHLWSARRIGFNPMRDARLTRMVVTTVLAAVPILLLARLVDVRVTLAGVEIPLSLFVVPPLGLAVYVFFAFATGALGVDEVFGTLTSLPEPLGSHAETLHQRVNKSNMSTESLQKLMVVAGILLFVAGIGFAFLNPGIGLGGLGDDSDVEQPMTTTATDDPATPTDGTTESADETAEPTDSPSDETTADSSDPTTDDASDPATTESSDATTTDDSPDETTTAEPTTAEPTQTTTSTTTEVLPTTTETSDETTTESADTATTGSSETTTESTDTTTAVFEPTTTAAANETTTTRTTTTTAA